MLIFQIFARREEDELQVLQMQGKILFKGRANGAQLPEGV